MGRGVRQEPPARAQALEPEDQSEAPELPLRSPGHPHPKRPATVRIRVSESPNRSLQALLNNGTEIVRIGPYL